jgi:hypothetical protein
LAGSVVVTNRLKTPRLLLGIALVVAGCSKAHGEEHSNFAVLK